jgi:hypothetical protein
MLVIVWWLWLSDRVVGVSVEGEGGLYNPGPRAGGSLVNTRGARQQSYRREVKGLEVVRMRVHGSWSPAESMEGSTLRTFTCF